MCKVKWTHKMYNDWRCHCHSLGLEYIPCDLEDLSTISTESLKFALCRFIIEVKKVNGEDFPGKILYDIIVSLQFYLESCVFSFKLINDKAFCDLKFTLDKTMKERTVHGIGISVKKAQVLSATDEDLFWSSGFLGTSYPDQLVNPLFHWNIK